MMTLWESLDASMQAAIVGVGGTVLTAIIALFAIAWQLSAQRKQSNDAIAENERRKLKAAMYEDAVKVARELVDSAIALSTPIRITALQVRTVAAAAAEGRQFMPPQTSVPDVLQKWSAAQEAVVRFIFLVEERRFIDPRLLVFRSAMNSVAHDAREAMDGNLFVRLVDVVQHQLHNGDLSQYVPPIETAEHFNSASERLLSALQDMQCYAEDFLVELQNILLGDLFGNAVSHRAPIDPNSKVVSLANFDDLEVWFNNSTPWGRHCAAVEAETRQRFGQDGTAGAPRN